MIKSYLSASERHGQKANDAERRRADLEKKAAAKESQMYDARSKADKERLQKDLRAEKVRQQQQDAAIRAMETRLSSYRPPTAQPFFGPAFPHSPIKPAPKSSNLPEYHLFISHASEDKGDIARPLYDELHARGINVWFDEATLVVGDSLRRKIDEGLQHSRFGVVVLSHAFFAKEWPQIELDGLFARQTSEGRKVILPIWHKLSKDEVSTYSPTLAGTLALQSSMMTVSEMADELAKVAKA